jgi:hypothetical protein
MKDTLRIFEAAQNYRHWPIDDQKGAVETYKFLIETIRKEVMADLESARMMPSREQIEAMKKGNSIMDLNMIRALISQAPIEDLRQVKDAVDKEMQCYYDIKTKNAEATQSIRKIPDAVDTRHATTATPESAVRTVEDRLKLHTSDSGATSSHESIRYDLIPRSLTKVAAMTYTMGAKKHGERGYQRGLADRGFILDRLNHIQEHWDMLRHPSIVEYEKRLKQLQETGWSGEVNDEAVSYDSIRANIGAMLWGLGFLTEVIEHEEGKGILLGLVAEGRVRVARRVMPEQAGEAYTKPSVSAVNDV